MNNEITKIVYFLSVFLIVNCKGLESDQLTGKYYLVSGDYNEGSMSLNYKLENTGDFVGVVDEAVFAVGYNDKYIIVKQHPRKFPDPPDRYITNYFIVPIYKEPTLSPEIGLIGPLTEDEFKLKQKELKIESLTFK